jgi:hypothetical protein
MSTTRDCNCNQCIASSKPVEYFKINGSRIELRCGNCNGLVNWWVEHPRTRNIVPVKRGGGRKKSANLCVSFFQLDQLPTIYYGGVE